VKNCSAGEKGGGIPGGDGGVVMEEGDDDDKGGTVVDVAEAAMVNTAGNRVAVMDVAVMVVSVSMAMGLGGKMNSHGGPAQ
jgi:hypothetical protein